MNENISARDLELLSSFVDNQLSPSELKYINTRLAVEEGLQEALQGLQRTKLILAALPQKPIPRVFSIPLGEKKDKFDLFQYFQVFRFSSIGAALVLVILLVMDFFLPSARSAATSAERAVQAPASSAALAEESAEKPVIITWASPQPYAFGRGAGGGGAADLTESGLAAETTPQDLQVPAPMDNAKKAPDEGLTAPMLEQAAPPQMQEAPPISGTGPILGIPPSTERGVLPTASPLPVESRMTSLNVFLLLKIGLALLALLMALLALMMRKRLG